MKGMYKPKNTNVVKLKKYLTKKTKWDRDWETSDSVLLVYSGNKVLLKQM